MLIIRKLHASDIKNLQELTLSTFVLGSLAIDENIQSQIQGKYFYNTICKNSFYPNSNSCFIASLNGKPVGYIIYGINKKINQIINLETGAIILFAVDKTQQNRGIGTKLLEAALNFFQQKNIKLVTVGTDSNNLSALHLYQKFGFKKISDWDTFRLHQNQKITKLEKDEFITEPFGDEKNCLQILTGSVQENSLWREKSIEPKSKIKLKKTISQKIIEQIKLNNCYSLIAKDKKNKTVGIIVYNRDKNTEKLFNDSANNKILQIKAIATNPQYNSEKIFKALLKELVINRKGINYIEAFCGFDKPKYKKALEECSFAKIHTTTTLHLNL